MGTSFVILFPLGAIIIRFIAAYLPVPATKLHYIIQISTYLAVLAGMGLGIYLSNGIQFIYFRIEPPSTLLTNRSNFRYNYHRITFRPTRIGILSSPPFPQGSSSITTLVHICSSLVRSNTHRMRSSKWWVWIIIGSRFMEICDYLVVCMWLFSNCLCCCFIGYKQISSEKNGGTIWKCKWFCLFS